jgi:hypothetical protein
MPDFEKKQVIIPVKIAVTRLVELFEDTNPCHIFDDKIIKNYVYSKEKRIIA